MEERHLTHADTIKLLERRARQMGASDFTMGERTLDNWLSGTLRTAPQPVRRRVLEAEFGHSIAELLSTVEDEAHSADWSARELAEGASRSARELAEGALAGRPAIVADRRAVSAAAARSARFGQRADGNEISDLALEQLRLRLAQLSAGYVHTPIWPVFTELTSLRDDVFDLLEAPDPARTADLYEIAGTACAMLAHASGNLGFVNEAGLQAHTALICARRADHAALAAWALGVRALQAEWHGRAPEALTYLERAGREFAGGGSRGGTMPAWLAAIDARAQASLGRPKEATAALARVDHAGPGGSSGLDAIGGIFTFPEAKQLFYSASTFRRLGQMAAAEARALDAITAYEAGPTDQRSYGDEALAWVEVAIARAGQDELDGAAVAIERVQSMPAERHLPLLLQPLRDLAGYLSSARVRTAGAATRIRQTVDVLITSTRRQVTDAGA
jgi:hypothetical protein